MTQREIKFKAWDKENKKWIKNNYYLDLDGIAFSLCFHSCECGTGGEHQEEVGNVELMQYTGLKDRNGVEIYEGDIVYCKVYDKKHYASNEGKREIYWGKEFGFCFREQEYTHGLPLSWGGYKDIEIIGNIYENPELLQDSTKES